MGKVKAMYEEMKTVLEETTSNLEDDRNKLKEAYVLINSVSKLR